MRKTIFIYFLVHCSFLFSQDNLDFERIKDELKGTSSSLYVKLSIPSSDFYIEITKDSIINNPFYKPCVELKSDLTKNKDILDILDKNELLDQFFITKEDLLVKVSNGNQSNFENQIMNIELIFKSNYVKQPIILLIFKKDKAVELLNEFYDLFEKNECFIKMKKAIKT